MTRRRKYLLLLIPATLLLVLVLLVYSSWGLSLGLRIASAVIPGELSAGEVEGSLPGPIEIRALRYSNDSVTVMIKRLTLEWHARDLLSGKLSVTALGLNDVNIDIHPQQAESEETGEQIDIILPIAIDIAQASLRELQIKIADTANPVLIDSIHLNARADRQTVVIRQAQVAGYDLDTRFSGTLTLSEYFPMKLDLALSYQMDPTHRLNTSGTFNGDLRKLQLSQRISGFAQANLVAEASDLLNELKWDAQLTDVQIDLQEIVAESPALEIQGKIEAKGDLNNLHIDSQLDIEEGDIGLAKLKLSGDSDLLFSDYRFNMDGDFAGVDLPMAAYTLQGQGNLQQIAFSRIAIQGLEGKIHGDAKLSWLPYFAMNANLGMENLNTGVLSKQWPGRLSGMLTLRTERDTSNHPIHFKLHDLKGEVRNYPLQANAKGMWANNTLVLDPLKLNIGGTQVVAQGRLANQWDMSFNANSDNLNALWPTAKGKLALAGKLSGTAAKPKLALQGDGSAFSYEDTSAGKILLKLEMGLGEQAPAEIDIQVGEFQSPFGHWGKVHLHTSGTNSAHVIRFDANNEAASVSTRLQGKFEPWRWKGSLDELNAEETHVGKWQLKKPASLVLAQDQFQLSSLCLARNGSHLCTELQWDQQKHQAMLEGKALPLALLEPWLPDNIELSGELDVRGNLTKAHKETLQAHVEILSADKSIVVNFVEVGERLILGASTVSAVLDKKGLTATLHLPLSDGGGVDSHASLPGWTVETGFPRTQPVQAIIKVDRIPADTITRFIPDLARAQGNLQADLTLNGSLGEPALRGSAQWRGGAMLIPAAGINVRDVNLEVRSAPANTIEFHARARSGEGEVKLEGHTRLDPIQGWPTRATLTSQNLEVMNIPEAYVIIDSRVQVELQGNTLNIDGEVTVPHAKLRPRALPEGTVSPSRDVVIISEEQEEQIESGWLVTSRLRVNLGELVNFDGFDIRGKLRGTLLLIDEPGKLVVGQGEVRIEDGIYRMRGQDLSIRRGRLIFSNTFIDDPGIDVEAIREIETIIAGVRLKGTLKQPQLTVFSEPSMSESDTLSYLILGHAPSQSTATEAESMRNTATALGFVAGDLLAKQIGGRLGLDELRVDVGESAESTALVMGKYLSPKLYLRYFSGLVESSSIVQMEYHLSKHVQLQTEGGYRGSQSVTGGDIFFTIEY